MTVTHFSTSIFKPQMSSTLIRNPSVSRLRSCSGAKCLQPASWARLRWHLKLKNASCDTVTISSKSVMFSSYTLQKTQRHLSPAAVGERELSFRAANVATNLAEVSRNWCQLWHHKRLIFISLLEHTLSKSGAKKEVAKVGLQEGLLKYWILYETGPLVPNVLFSDTRLLQPSVETRITAGKHRWGDACNGKLIRQSKKWNRNGIQPPNVAQIQVAIYWINPLRHKYYMRI